MNYLVAYSTQPKDTEWQLYGFYNSATVAGANYDALCAISDAKTGDAPITQVAIFIASLNNKPRYMHDNRDKSDWPIGAAAGGLVNSVNSDFTINGERR